MTDPLRITFDVACPADHAFTVWTSHIGTWWPPDHTVSGRGDVVLERRVGGRIYERTDGGDEHDWGEILVWEPPMRLIYLWHIGRARSDATEVEVRFIARHATLSTVEIEHRGWERLGPGAATWRSRNAAGWDAVLPRFRAAVGT
jgi:uncharacterized protein YndB with AHSA1/START domain